MPTAKVSGWWSESVTQIGHLESFIERVARGQWTIHEVSIGMRSAGNTSSAPSCPCLAFKLAKGAPRGCVMTSKVFVPQRVRTEDSSPVSNTDHKAEAKTADNVGSLHPKSEIAVLSCFFIAKHEMCVRGEWPRPVLPSNGRLGAAR